MLRKVTAAQVERATELLTQHRPKPHRADGDQDEPDDGAAEALVPA